MIKKIIINPHKDECILDPSIWINFKEKVEIYNGHEELDNYIKEGWNIIKVDPFIAKRITPTANKLGYIYTIENSYDK